MRKRTKPLVLPEEFYRQTLHPPAWQPINLTQPQCGCITVNITAGCFVYCFARLGDRRWLWLYLPSGPRDLLPGSAFSISRGLPGRSSGRRISMTTKGKQVAVGCHLWEPDLFQGVLGAVRSFFQTLQHDVIQRVAVDTVTQRRLWSSPDSLGSLATCYGGIWLRATTPPTHTLLFFCLRTSLLLLFHLMNTPACRFFSLRSHFKCSFFKLL